LPTLNQRQSGINGPYLGCVGADCTLFVCQSAPACQHYSGPPPDRPPQRTLDARCPPGLDCGVDPECSIHDCQLELCAESEVCKNLGERDMESPKSDFLKRDIESPEPDFPKRLPNFPKLDTESPKPDFPKCGIDSLKPDFPKRNTDSLKPDFPKHDKETPQPDLPKRDMETSKPDFPKRDTETSKSDFPKRDAEFPHPCPEICNEEGHCGCACGSVEAPVAKRDEEYHPCPLFCNEAGQCGCAAEPPNPPLPPQ